MKRKIQGETQGIFSIQFGGDYIPNRFKRGFAKNQLTIWKVSMRLCGLADNICFSQDVKIKVALSSLQLSIIELVFAITAAGVVPCGGPKKSSIVQIIFFF